MANEITVQSKLGVSNGNTKDTLINKEVRVDQATLATAALKHSTEQVVTTTAAALSVGGVVAVGFVYLRNLDATNYVQYGPDNAGTMVVLGRMKPGEPAGPFRLDAGATLKLQANTASCKVQIELVAD